MRTYIVFIAKCQRKQIPYNLRLIQPLRIYYCHSLLEKFSGLYIIGPVHFTVGDNRLSRAPWLHSVFDDIHAHFVCVQNALLMHFTMRKKRHFFIYFHCFYLSFKHKKLNMINLMIRKPNSVSEDSSWMLFIVTQASSMPIARTFSKARLKIMKPFDVQWMQKMDTTTAQYASSDKPTFLWWRKCYPWWWVQG